LRVRCSTGFEAATIASISGHAFQTKDTTAAVTEVAARQCVCHVHGKILPPEAYSHPVT
jgi:hypothetical protein